jgi:hypothetical protein
MASSKNLTEQICQLIGRRNHHIVFKFINAVYMVLDTLSSTLLGYSLVNGWHQAQELAKARLDKSGNLVQILARGSSNAVGGFSALHNFMLWHDSYVDPVDFVLNNDRVTFMGVSETQVWFSVITNANVYGLGQFPFVFIPHFFVSEKILLINHATLHRLADILGDPQGECILINNTGRCGSTLLCQVNDKYTLFIYSIPSSSTRNSDVYLYIAISI